MEEIRNGDIYRHFKNKLYQIVAAAKHSETGELMVVYQALYGDYGYYVRPASMFFGLVDKEKYPMAQQQYRFERVEKEELIQSGDSINETPSGYPGMPFGKNKESTHLQENSRSEAAVTDRLAAGYQRPGSEEDELVTKYKNDMRRFLIDFLDKEGWDEKQAMLARCHKLLDNRVIDDIAMAMDLTIKDGPIEVRISELQGCLRTLARYDGSRLR